MDAAPSDAAAVIAWADAALPASYGRLLRAVITEAATDERIQAVLLTGSLARRDALPGTDIDLRYLFADDRTATFGRRWREGLLIETALTTESAASEKLITAPMNVYAHLDGVALYDPSGALRRLREQAVAVSAGYRVPDERRRELAEMLGHPQDKLRVALAAGDLLRATYTLSTSSWQLIDGLWAANDLPVPPNASVRAHLGDLSGPDDIEDLFPTLFLGSPLERARTGLELIGWVRERLSDSTHGS